MSAAHKELSYEEAVRVLGFEPGAIVSPHLPAFRQVEEKLGELIEKTGDEKQKGKYSEELTRLHEALRVVENEGKGKEPSMRSTGMALKLVASLLLIAGLVGAAWWGNEKLKKDRAVTQETNDVSALVRQGEIAVENRRWPEAEEIYRKIAEADPESELVKQGLARIAEGKETERRQKLGFLLGSVRASIEARNWTEAEEKIVEVLEMESDHEEIPELRKMIDEGRTFDKVIVILTSAEEALRDEEWANLAKHTIELEKLVPDHAELARLKRETAEGMKILEEQRVQALALYRHALSLDDGSYSEEALEALRSALRLSDEPEIQALYEKMSGYTRILEVPTEFATISEALEAARDRDRVVIKAGTYVESLVVKTKVDMEGAGEGKTIIECESKTASVLLASGSASGCRVAGITLRQSGISLEDERYPVVVADAAELNLENCRIENGSGHGIAIINGGSGNLQSVRVSKCGWDGLAVYGEGSKAVVENSRFEANIHHGVDAWGGGSVEAKVTRSTLNGLAGFVMMSPGVTSQLLQCTSDRNRDVGYMVSNGSKAKLQSNRAESNLLGGIVIEGEGTEASLDGNVVERNEKVGILVDQRSTLTSYKRNTSRLNKGDQSVLKAKIPEAEVSPPPPLLEIPETVSKE